MVAHGCTGKGNDQVRFEVGIGALGPDLQVLAPVRDSGMTRDKAIAFAEENAACRSRPRRSRRTRSTRTCGAARSRPASSRTSGTAPSRTSTTTRQTPRSPASADEVVITFTAGVPVASTASP